MCMGNTEKNKLKAQFISSGLTVDYDTQICKMCKQANISTENIATPCATKLSKECFRFRFRTAYNFRMF